MQLANNRNVARNMSHRFPHPYREADADTWLALHESGVGPFSLAIEIAGRAVGTVSVRVGDGDFARSGELGYWIGEPYWGNGIVTEAVGSFVPNAMAHLRLIRVFAYSLVGNVGSIRVLEKCGFAREGLTRSSVYKDGKAYDRFLYAKVIEAGGSALQATRLRRAP